MARRLAAVLGRRRRSSPPHTEPPIAPTMPDDRGTEARRAFAEGRYDDAEQRLREILRTAPSAPTTTYLLGLLELRGGRFEPARQLIDRAYQLRHWVDDRVELPNAPELLRAAQQHVEGWAWPGYQLARLRWRSEGLNLPAAVAHLVAQREVVPSFVQIGANDGQRDDPLRNLIERYGLPGLLVEPQPQPFEALQRTYSGRTGLSFAQVAVTDADGPVTMTTACDRDTLGTLVPERNLMRRGRDDSMQLEVQGQTFDTLARAHGIGRFELLQIDTEGYDLRILEQVPLAEHGVEIVNMELFCLPLDERMATFELLDQAGFAWTSGPMDLLGVRRSTFTDAFGIVEID